MASSSSLSLLASSSPSKSKSKSKTITPSSSENNNNGTVDVVAVERVWRCDVCQQAVFRDYQEACRHEELCQRRGLKPKKAAPKTVATPLTVSAATMAATSVTTAAPLGNSTRKAPTQTTAVQMSKPRKNPTVQSTSQDQDPHPKKKTPTTIMAARDVSPDASPSESTTTMMKQTRNQPPPLPSSCESPSSDHGKTSFHPKQNPLHSFFAPRRSTGTGTTQPTTTSRSKSITTSIATTTVQSKKGHRPVPRMAQSFPVRPKEDEVEQQEDSGTVYPSQNPLQDDTDDVVHVVRPFKSKRPKPTTTTATTTAAASTEGAVVAVAGIFQNKSMQQLMAEHKQAEFQAKRRLQRQRDRERQPTTTAAAGESTQEAVVAVAGIFQNKSMQQLMADHKQAEFQAKRRMQRQLDLDRQQKRLKRMASTTTTTATPTTSCAPIMGPLPIHCRLPLAPRFPVPSHVGIDLLWEYPKVPKDESSHWIDLLLGNDHGDTTTTQTMTGKTIDPTSASRLPPLQVVGTIPSPPPPLMDPGITLRDLLQEACFTTLRLPLPSTPRPSQSSSVSYPSTMTIPWSQSYGHAQHPIGTHTIVGDSTLQAAATLEGWIRSWCTTRQQALDRMKERQMQLMKMEKNTKTKKKNTTTTKKTMTKKPKKTFYDVYDDDDSDNEQQQHELVNVYLLTGPPASGKTGLVHAVAKTCHCSVVEINTTCSRSGSALKHSIQEATQSCSTMHMFQQKQQTTAQESSMILSVLDDTDDDDDDDDDDNDDYNDEEKKNKKTASLTVILIDEVDLIYETEGDSGFWSALSSVAKTARCPILLTANTVPAGLANIKYSHLELERPSPMDCAIKVLQVCQQENIPIMPSLNPMIVQERLAYMASICQCDLRKLLNHLQLFAAPTVLPNSNRSSPISDDNTVFPKSISVSQPSQPSCTSSAARPTVQSVVPSRVPFDRYTVLTVHGSGFAICEEPITVHLGDESCHAQVVDDERILLLCPPCSNTDRPSSRVKSLVLSCPNGGEFDVFDIKSMTLFDHCNLPVLKPLFVEYLVPEIDEMEDSEEQEFRDGKTTADPKTSSVTVAIPTLEDGLELWEKTVAEEKGIKSHVDPQPTRVPYDESMINALEDMAKAYEYLSDAAYLEDFQCGIPHLSGACRGFGFELTEEGSGFADTGNKLRLNENSRPPGEERLFRTGWQDNCFFHGTPETYMTRPATAQERRTLVSAMEAARGERHTKLDMMLPIDRDDENSSDLDDIVRRDCTVSEEDMFLSQHISSSLAALPELLRLGNANVTSCHWTANELFENRRLVVSCGFKKHLSSMFDRNLSTTRAGMRTISRELLSLNDHLDPTVATEFLPTLRRIATLERSRDAEHKAQQLLDPRRETSTRSTRLQTRTARKHHFDSISKKLAWDEAPQSTEDVADQLAQSLLTYISTF